MKKIFSLLLFVLPLIISAQTNVTINAKIKGLKPGNWVYCRTFDNTKKDSVKTVKDGFQFRLNIPEGKGDIYVLQIGKDFAKTNVAMLFIDKGNIIIQGNGPEFKDVKISGTKSINEYNSYNFFLKHNAQYKEGEKLSKQINDLYEKHDSIGLAKLRPRLKLMYSTRNKLAIQWVNKHKNSNVSAYIIASDINFNGNSEELEALINKLTPYAKNNIPAKSLLQSLKEEKTIEDLSGIGKIAPDFTQTDTSGTPKALTNFRGKYVLLDFWASWCAPCRAENPNVVKVYNTYKSKNFTILSISFDYQKANWLQAIQKDGLAWNQASDLKGWENAVGKEYGIKSIPANLLIDPSGKIIAKDLHGDELSNKLAEVLNK